MRALVLGCGGQDGSFLCDILLEKGYEVHGLYRRSSVDNLTRIQHIRDSVTLHEGDITDIGSISRVLRAVDADEIYNEADQDSVGWSRKTVGASLRTTGVAVGEILEMILHLRNHSLIPNPRFFQPCSAMMFGDPALLPSNTPCPQNENTPIRPQSPYGCAKALAYYLAKHYREQHGMFVATGILYNHDSERRSDQYLLHKICKGAVEIDLGKRETLALGNLDGRVDVGYAKDYMEAAWSILQLEKPDDFVISSTNSYSVASLVDEAFRQLGMHTKDRIVADPQFFKTYPGVALRGDISKIRNTCGWIPRTSVEELIGIIIESEMRKNGKTPVRYV